MAKRERGAGRNSDTKTTKKKAYKKPQLTVYGTLAKLTEGIGGSNADPGQGNMTKRGRG